MHKQHSPFHRRPAADLRLVRAKASEEAEILIYDVISSWWGVSADAFKRELDGLDAKTIHVRINSVGGEVFEAVAIYNQLREHPATIVTHVDGVAASAASLIALAGDEVRMSDTAWFMVHRALNIVIGNAEEMRKNADFLDKIDATLEDVCKGKTGASLEQVREWLDAETWFRASEALDAGFIDTIDNPTSDEEDLAGEAAALFDLSVFANTPSELLRVAAAARRPTEREIETALRDAGLSRKEARSLVACYQPQWDAEAEPTGGQRDAAVPSGLPVGRSSNVAAMQLLELGQVTKKHHDT